MTSDSKETHKASFTVQASVERLLRLRVFLVQVSGLSFEISDLEKGRFVARE